MLSGPQKTYIRDSFTKFASSLTKDQLQQFYFRLDDLAQYGHGSLDVAYAAVARLCELSEEKRSKLIEQKEKRDALVSQFDQFLNGL